MYFALQLGHNPLVLQENRYPVLDLISEDEDTETEKLNC